MNFRQDSASFLASHFGQPQAEQVVVAKTVLLWYYCQHGDASCIPQSLCNLVYGTGVYLCYDRRPEPLLIWESHPIKRVNPSVRHRTTASGGDAPFVFDSFVVEDTVRIPGRDILKRR